MDLIDEKILHALQTNAGLTSAKLGEAVHLSPSATHRRVKLLEDAGLIRGYRARLSAAARGDPSTVFVAVTLRDQTEETLTRFEAALQRCGEVVEAHLMGGEYDYLLKLSVRSDASFERVHRDTLARLPGVQRLVTHFSIRAIVDPE